MRRISCLLTNSVENFSSAEVEVLGSLVLSIKLEGSATMSVSEMLVFMYMRPTTKNIISLYTYLHDVLMNKTK